MQCPRLKHFVRLESSGDIGRCGHMHDDPTFKTIEQMEQSAWLASVNDKFEKGLWPDECIRCQTTEQLNQQSIRLDAIERDKILQSFKKDYLIVGGVLDNICNSACQTCDASLSSKIGSLSGQTIKVNNYEKFKSLPLDRIVELDINGGEPTYSPNYKKILNNLPPNVKIVRINTNAHKPFDTIISLLDKGVRVIMTVSFDGLEKIHDYVRWPIKFVDVNHTIKEYKKLQRIYKSLLRLNLWTTVSVYNVNQFDSIVNYARSNEIEHGFAILERPHVLSIVHKNKLTMEAKIKYANSSDQLFKNLSSKVAILDNNSKNLQAYINQQDHMRSISFVDYFNFEPNLL